MRLWHKDLIKVLPSQQLLGQWRECCLIAKIIAAKGTPGHILVNKIMDYSLSHFYTYGRMIYIEMVARGFHPDFSKFSRWFSGRDTKLNCSIFESWHNERYLLQCVHMLQERYDCGGITLEEWVKILKFVPFLSLKEKVV